MQSETSDNYPLEPSEEEFRELVDKALGRIVPFVKSLPDQRAGTFDDGEALARSLAEAAPEGGTGYDELLDIIFDKAVPHSFNTASPGYLAFIPGGGILHTAVAGLIADAVNRYVTVFMAAPGMVQLEVNVVRWFCELIGMPKGSGGLLTTGGSMANFIAIVTARREKLPEDFMSGTIYVSDQVHHCVNKSALLAGFPKDRVRSVPSDDSFRMRFEELESMIALDRAKGLTPFMVVASSGTTNTGAIDPLQAIAELCKNQELWFHVDAAYGGFFNLTERGRQRLTGIELADSVVLDPHKGLFLPYGTGSLLVREPAALGRAHSVTSEYMPPYQEDPDLVDFCALSPELSRGNRGLRAWLPIKLLGLGVFREALDEKLDLTTHALKAVRKIPNVRIVAEPELSLFAFRLEPEGVIGEALDALNQAWLDATNRPGRVMLTGTYLHGRMTLRICILSFRTHLERIEMAVEDLKLAAKEVLEA
ncbi:MAG: aromatic-L-amino-acid decarboxylase [Planctomycetota bacterium]|jgi:aromatic-L-amino-acid decarboxylase